MRIIDTIPVLEEDTRRRVLVPPARVILTRGRVEGADALLQPGELQIRLREGATVRMENRDGGERAAVRPGAPWRRPAAELAGGGR